MLKVNAGRPRETSLAANVKNMESEFNGKSTALADGSVFLTSTPSTSVNTPRHIFTTMSGGRLYCIFIAADQPDRADATCDIIRSSLMVIPKPDAVGQ